MLSGVKSDSHTWNLVYLELLLRERGHDVLNLGPCVPVSLLVDEAVAVRPDLVVFSTVNGHGLRDGIEAIQALRARPILAEVPVAIGGKLDVAGTTGSALSDPLLAAGFTAVFNDDQMLDAFHAFLDTVCVKRD
ncbi:cobalamin B12-binding domain-containing protein [Micromonospora sp. NPDC051227]|uniref:cobalamin B12-binding domain-containing protein n=1 Tax=Micromonospora sp. NPDC051227 TaxID=3364285 RepID=UPI003789469C